MSEAVAVNILDREYLVACSPEERPGLVAAAAYLDAKLRELRDAHRGGGLERMAILAALNISHELLDLRRQRDASGNDLAQHLQAIKAKLDAGLPASLQ